MGETIAPVVGRHADDSVFTQIRSADVRPIPCTVLRPRPRRTWLIRQIIESEMQKSVDMLKIREDSQGPACPFQILL